MIARIALRAQHEQADPDDAEDHRAGDEPGRNWSVSQ